WPAISRALEATLLRVYRQRRDPTVDDPGPRASLCQRATRPRLRRPQERTRRTRRALDGPHAAYAPGAGGRLRGGGRGKGPRLGVAVTAACAALPPRGGRTATSTRGARDLDRTPGHVPVCPVAVWDRQAAARGSPRGTHGAITSATRGR